MLQVVIPGIEEYNEVTNEFIYVEPLKLTLEHSLISISKWESKWHKPFLTSQKNEDEIIDYISCMSINKNITANDLIGLDQETLDQINEYIDNSMTATVITNNEVGHASQFVTSELIYYWMTKCSIPFECEKWHLNRLMMLIRVCMEENNPKKEMPKADVAAQYRALNAQRLKEWNTKG